MPKWGLSMEEATITEWMLEPGEDVAQGQVLAVVESEKAQVDLPAPVGGVLVRYLAEEGETVEVGAEIALIAGDRAEYEQLASGEGS